MSTTRSSAYLRLAEAVPPGDAAARPSTSAITKPVSSWRSLMSFGAILGREDLDPVILHGHPDEIPDQYLDASKADCPTGLATHVRAPGRADRDRCLVPRPPGWMKSSRPNSLGVLVLEIGADRRRARLLRSHLGSADLASRGLTADLARSAIAYNEVAGTLRGLHFQAAPTARPRRFGAPPGEIFDVAVDLRDGSPTPPRWVGVELSAANRRGLSSRRMRPWLRHAHGRSEVQYQISTPYRPDAARGYRWDDPTLAIDWPVPIRRISARDAALPFVDRTRPT